MNVHVGGIGSKIRVCQVLIFPPFQGRGLGRHALLTVYALAASREAIIEVTVEDPCEGFQRLRDAVDLEWTLLIKKPLSLLKDSMGDVAGGEAGLTLAVSDINVTQVGCDLKIVPAQVQFVLNTIAYRQLLLQQQKQQQQQKIEVIRIGEKRPLELEPPPVENGKADTLCSDASSASSVLSSSHPPAIVPIVSVTESWKKFRLGIKKQLLKANGDLKGLKKSDMQKELDVMYKESETRFESCCTKLYLWK